ncbi:methyl-accepting chemotaxis protein [Bdellovibrio sp. 22V]|uniref:HAMP domain-containing methyl-accepting chemotaxis protein n=1 Tax=Bdellovibrio sp. 22V TaxID=3044166 RepID=UPI002543CAA6|nr:methyl-accepting chemotaxis protein [Bdellovibrio sp. 22V]WII72046.1 methyl-accepting chemotaxis protein [Bdellovibrio sp. 22V]
MNSSSLSSWFKGIKGKLLFAAALPLVGFGTVWLISHSGMSGLAKVISSSNNDVIPSLQGLGQIRTGRNKFGYQAYAALNFRGNAEKKAERLKIAREAIDEIKKGIEFYESFPFTPEGEKLWAPMARIKEPLFASMEKVVKLLEEGNYDEAQNILATNIWDYGVIMNGATTSSLNYYNERVKAETLEANESVKTANTMVLTVTLISCFLISAILLWIASRVSASVGSIAERLTGAGNQVASAVEQLNEAGNSLSQSSTEAAASLEETVAALEEMSSMVQMNSDNAKQAAALSASSRDAAETGEREIQTLIQSMTEISKSSKKIEEIISVIDDIAFQTNLLALNAAVEAARAGEQGKGFAVVAEAVRALAQRSAAAAKDITTLIKDSVSQIENGSEIADKSGTVLSNIVNSVKKVSDLNTEIAAASSEQTTGIQQISKAMNQLDQAAQSNAASAEEIAATSGEINNLAMTSQNLTVELNTIVLGASELPAGQVMESKTKVAHKPAAKPTVKNKVIPFKTKPATAKKKDSQDVIPFDEDERAKVGTTDGF